MCLHNVLPHQYRENFTLLPLTVTKRLFGTWKLEVEKEISEVYYPGK
jgi:hypothetical protein